jgi:hypothetical protein
MAYVYIHIYVWAGQLSHYSVWLRAGRLGDWVSIPGRDERIFPLTSVSIPAVGPAQPPVQWIPGVLFPELKSGRGVTLITHPYLVPRSRMSRSCTSSSSKRLCDNSVSILCQLNSGHTLRHCLRPSLPRSELDDDMSPFETVYTRKFDWKSAMFTENVTTLLYLCSRPLKLSIRPKNTPLNISSVNFPV